MDSTGWSYDRIANVVKIPRYDSTELYRLVWATKVALAAICLVFPALVLGYYFFIVESMGAADSSLNGSSNLLLNLCESM